MNCAKKYITLNFNHRKNLEKYLKEKLSISKIAIKLGFCRQTIYNEIKRGSYIHLNSDWTEEIRYCAEIGQEKANYNKTAKGPKLKIDCDIKLAKRIEELIVVKGYSPVATLEYIKKHESHLYTVNILSVNTLYSYIDKGIFETLKRVHLPRKRKRKPRKTLSIKERKENKLNYKHRAKELSIESRPSEVLNRSTFGHWEMDCVVGRKRNKKTLLVLTERYTRYEIIEVLKSKSSEQVSKALDRIEKRMGSLFYKVFKSVTVDNGSEFLNFNKIKKSLRRKGERFKLFYCHPYSSYERGSNENNNILIRRWFPKGSDFDEQITHRKVKSLEHWINTYPRRKLNGFCSKYLFDIEVKKLLC